MSGFIYDAPMDYVRPIEAVVPGVQGRVLGVLARTHAEQTMRTVAGLAGVSVQQASVVLAHLVELGVVTRRDVGSAALVQLARDNEAARVIVALAGLASSLLPRLRAEARRVKPAPASLMVFGSFVRGEAGTDSDLDVLAVRPTGTAADDDRWADTLGRWQDKARRMVGNPINLLELSSEELDRQRASRGSVWQAIATEGVVLVGARIVIQGRGLALVDGGSLTQAVS